MPDLITILGPTATGKTQLAALLAYELAGEIISADSRQVYRGMDIGSGKDLDDYKVKGRTIPYHLIDIASPGEEYNVFSFQQDFLQVYPQILKRKHQPILCGGTGMYLEAVLNGYLLRKVPENTALRKRLFPLSLDNLVEKLSDYGTLHNTTDTKDKTRTIRAIEIREFDKPHPVKESFPKINFLNIGISLTRELVRQRITARLRQRLENGMIKEVEGLLNRGLKPNQLSFYGLEYRFVTQYVMDEISYDEMFSQLNVAIHQFSKRQMTWYRRMEKRRIRIHWIDGELSDNEKVTACLELIERH